MNLEEKTLSNLKHFMIYNTINSLDNKNFYNEMDELLVRKRFDNVSELSLNENIYKIDMTLITSKDVSKMVSDFIKNSANKKIYNKRNIYELLKVSNLPIEKLEKLFKDEKFLKLPEILSKVSRETSLLSFDFLVLRILDNFILKLKRYKKSNVEDFISTRDNVIKKIVEHTYCYDNKEREINFLCWVDRLLSATINKEISPMDFQNVCNKILETTTHTIYLYWKILNSINYLLLQHEFCSFSNLRVFRNDINKTIDRKYNLINLTDEEIKKLTISILSKNFPSKEDFYYLFDSIHVFSSNSVENKRYAIDLFMYILYFDAKYNLFSYRFIRKYFIEIIFKTIKQYDSIDVKNKELVLLLKMFHVDHFFSFYRKDIFSNIIDILKNINNTETKITNGNFYKYCDMIDYIMYTNKDITSENIVEYIAGLKDNKNKISKHFQLKNMIC